MDSNTKRGFGTLLWTATGLLLLAAFFVLIGIFLYGIPSVADVVFRYANPVAGFIFAADLVVLPLAFFRRLRPWIGLVLVGSSYIFGVVLWTFSALVCFSLWGYLGLFIGLIWLGIGVVPVALVASALHSAWFLVGAILGEAILVFGARGIGMWLLYGNNASASRATIHG